MESGKQMLLTSLSLLPTLFYIYNEPNFRWINLFPYLTPLLITLVMNFPNINLSKLIVFKQNHCNFTARLSLRAWRDEPDSVVRCFSTVLWEWNRLNRVKECHNLMEEFSRCGYWDKETAEFDYNPLFIDSPNYDFWNMDNPDIRYRMWVNRQADRDGVEHPEIFLRISFMRRDATPNQLIEHVQFIRDEAKRITKLRGRIQKVLVSQEEKKEEETSLSFMKFEFTTTSSFQNFFSEEADTARADIDYFLNNKTEYARTGRPWNYTVLNEGPPGVGKTKLVKSIAAYTGRTLVVLDLQHIESLRMLYEAFHSSVLGGEHLEHTKRLYYIPEVDTQIHNHLKQRTIMPEKPIIVLDDKESKDKDDKKSLWKGPKRPTLGEVLNILDGIPERHGHIIVIDTNHMNELDAALIRPGRVDRILSWGKMTAASMRRFLENFYRETIPADVVFPERKYTAAELQACVHRFPTLDEFLASVNMTREKLNSSERRSKHVRRTIA